MRWAWANGTIKPVSGTEIHHPALFRALRKSTILRVEEWQKFDIKSFQQDHYVTASAGGAAEGNGYFYPVPAGVTDVPAGTARFFHSVIRSQTHSGSLAPTISIQACADSVSVRVVIWRNDPEQSIVRVSALQPSLIFDGDVICMCFPQDNDLFGDTTTCRFRVSFVQARIQGKVRALPTPCRLVNVQIGVRGRIVQFPLGSGTSMRQVVSSARAAVGLRGPHDNHATFVGQRHGIGRHNQVGDNPSVIGLQHLPKTFTMGAWNEWSQTTLSKRDRSRLCKGGVEIYILPPPFELLQKPSILYEWDLGVWTNTKDYCGWLSRFSPWPVPTRRS